MAFWNEFAGPNAGYVFELYEAYLQDPSRVDAATRAIFERWQPPAPERSLNGASANGPVANPTVANGTITNDDAAIPVPAVDIAKVVGGVNYAEAIRNFGHAAAGLDPLGTPNIGDPALDPAAHGVSEADLRALPATLVGGPIASQSRDAWEATQMLREVYVSTLGYDNDHIRDKEEREWLRKAAESRQFSAGVMPLNPEMLLQRLTEVEAFERFIHRIFPGKHRFSIEGLDMMVPMLDEMIGIAAEHGVYNVLIGMAHRGRLNVLAHTLNKPYKHIFAEFKDSVKRPNTQNEVGWTGDVKYHLGARRALRGGAPIEMVIAMAPNPSHLEFVNPVVEGMARASGTVANKPGKPTFDPNHTLPVLIHGDAAFPGQGVVAETFNLSRLPGYWTGGTIHIIANNQLGYTTEPQDSRSTLYASDLAKGFKAPILHVNADDPEACIAAMRMAYAYLIRFQKDFVIDLIGYRRYGHNEGDEPQFTQPMMYKIVEKHPTARELWGRTLVARGKMKAGEPDAVFERQMTVLQALYETLDPESDYIEARPIPPPPGTAKNTLTAVSLDKLRELNSALLKTPDGFNVHAKLQRVIKRRVDAHDKPDDANIDWSNAEDLALASILEEGIAIRITGQDVERGTFSQRHAVFHDAQTGEDFIPLQNLPQAKAAYEIHNSPLSEQAAVGFEYGYNVQEPGRLVLWEAQYGDFDNGAQVIIDEFIVSARAKWGQTPSLVLLLPHGYEGAGPDHSSARPERFLQMAADTNMRVANPTTAAQYFHLLRRQALLLESDPLPLIVLTPKSLLRSSLIYSSLHDLADGHWHPVIDDPVARGKVDAVRRIILCSGKIAVELAGHERRKGVDDLAIVRVEQWYPFPTEEIHAVLDGYPNADQLIWMQEEPENMGAWEFARPHLVPMPGSRFHLESITRPRSSSPSEGSAAAHTHNQALLHEQAFGKRNAVKSTE